ncbi:MAG TPA: class I SAM-dependent methyltransferase [Burkholderiales bacterium]
MDKDKVKQAVEHVFRDMAGAMSAGMAYVGTRAGLFRAMQGKGPMRLDAVIAASRLHPRYVEEWLKGMTAAGYLEYEPSAQTFLLSDEFAYFLASEGSDHFVGGMWEMVPALMRVAPRVAESFRAGGGVPFGDFGPDCVHALDLINRGQYEYRFTDYWLKALPEVVAKLEAGGRVLDYGCGSGQVCIALAKGFPNSEVVGYDVDAASIAKAKAASQSRTAFTTEKPTGTFDLITICDCIHDLAAPVETLQQIKTLLKDDAVLFIIEPKAADRLEDNRNPVATMFYGFSIFHCMTQSLARGGPGLGTCLGPAGTERLLREAGFSRFRALDLKSQTNLFYAAGH